MNRSARSSVVRSAVVSTPAGTRGASIEIDGGVITAVVPTAGSHRGEIVAPGFIDLQVNGIDDVDCGTARDDDWTRAGALLAAAGVTAWLPTLVSRPLDRYDEPLRRIEAAREGHDGPVVLGAHLEGPFLGGRPGAHRPEAIVDVDRGWLEGLPAVVRLVTLAPERADATAAIAQLVADGVVVSLGHSSADFDTATAAVDAGARMVTHLFNGMTPLHHRRPGVAGVGLVDDRVVAGLIADLVHVHPAMIKVAFRTKGPRRIVLVSDCVAWRVGAAGLGRVEVVDGAPRLADGTLAGSSLTLDQAVRNVVDGAGIAPCDALRAASTTPADVLRDPSRGRIEVGARADLVVLDADDLSVRRTIVGGETVFEA